MLGYILCIICCWLLLMFKGNICKMLVISCKFSFYLVWFRGIGFWGRFFFNIEVFGLIVEVCGGGGDLIGGVVVFGVIGISYIG